MFCTNCGVPLQKNMRFCPNCGMSITDTHQDNSQNDLTSQYKRLMAKPKNKYIAAALAIFLGTAGIHNFYLGNNVKGIVQLIMFVCWMGWVSGLWAFIEGIMILTDNIKTDAFGIPLSNNF